MKFLIIGMNYHPEPTSVSPFTTGLCEHFVKSGHKVTVITTFPHYPEWRIYDDYRGKIYQRENINGVDVRRVFHFVPSKPSKFINRLLYDVSFPLAALFVLPFVGKYDGIFCPSPSPFNPWAAWLASKMKNKKFIIFLTDLASNAANSLGIMRSTFLTRLAHFVENFTYKRAAAIVAISPVFVKVLRERGIENNKILLISLWANSERIKSLHRENIFRKQNKISGELFVVAYSGNMGMKQGLETVVEASKMSFSSDNMLWLLVGEGERRAYLQKLAKQKNLNHLHFLPLQPKTMVPYMLAAADVLMLIQKADIVDSVIPSKLLVYMASGRPIVASVHERSEAARLIHEANCGIIVSPEEPEALFEAVYKLRNSPEEMAEYGSNGRLYVEKYFSKELILKRYEELFRKVFN